MRRVCLWRQGGLAVAGSQEMGTPCVSWGDADRCRRPAALLCECAQRDKKHSHIPNCAKLHYFYLILNMVMSKGV